MFQIMLCDITFELITATDDKQIIKVGLSPSEKHCVIYLIESPLKMIKNAFYFKLKVLFVLKIFKFLS